MIISCPTKEAVEYLRIKWSKCRDIEVSTAILLEKDPKGKERIMTGIDEQSNECSKPLSTIRSRTWIKNPRQAKSTTY